MPVMGTYECAYVIYIFLRVYKSFIIVRLGVIPCIMFSQPICNAILCHGDNKSRYFILLRHKAISLL